MCLWGVFRAHLITLSRLLMIPPWYESLCWSWRQLPQSQLRVFNYKTIQTDDLQWFFSSVKPDIFRLWLAEAQQGCDTARGKRISVSQANKCTACNFAGWCHKRGQGVLLHVKASSSYLMMTKTASIIQDISNFWELFLDTKGTTPWTFFLLFQNQLVLTFLKWRNNWGCDWLAKSWGFTPPVSKSAGIGSLSSVIFMRKNSHENGWIDKHLATPLWINPR